MAKLKNEIANTSEVAAIATLMAVALDAGFSVAAALDAATEVSTGPVTKRIRKSLQALDLGSNLHDELHSLRNDATAALSELVVKLQVAIQFGAPLAGGLEALVASLEASISHMQLTISAKQENTMLLPLVFLILPVTVLFAVFPSMQYLNLNY